MPRRTSTPALRGGLLAALAVLGVAGGAAASGMWGGGGGRIDAPGRAHDGGDGVGLADPVAAGAPPPTLAARGGGGADPALSPSPTSDAVSSPSDAPTSSTPRPARRPSAGRKAEDLGQRTWRTILAHQADDGRLPVDPALWPCTRGEVALPFRVPEETSDDEVPAVPTVPPPPPPPFDPRDVLPTAYGIEALHAEWYTNRSGGAEGRFLSKALLWLKRRQDEQGGFGARDAPTTALADARATLAFVKIYGMTGGEWILPTTTRALEALGRRFDRTRSDAIEEDDPEFPEAALAAALACGGAAQIAAYERRAGKPRAVVPPLGLVRTLCAWADDPALEGSSLELHRAAARVCLGADPKTDPALLRIVARLRNEGGEPVVPTDPLERCSAAVVMGTARYEDWCAWHGTFWTTAHTDFPVSSDPCDPRTKTGTLPDLRTLSLQAMARGAFGYTKCYGDPPPVNAMDEARRALRPEEDASPTEEPDLRTGSR